MKPTGTKPALTPTRTRLEDLGPETRARLVEALPDDQIILSGPNAPKGLDRTGAVRGRFDRPLKNGLRIGAEVLGFFESQAPAYQTRINNVLRESVLGELRRLASERTSFAQAKPVSA